MINNNGFLFTVLHNFLFGDKKLNSENSVGSCLRVFEMEYVSLHVFFLFSRILKPGTFCGNI